MYLAQKKSNFCICTLIDFESVATNTPGSSKPILLIKVSSAVRPSGATGGGGGSGRTSTSNSRNTEADTVVRARDTPALNLGATTGSPVSAPDETWSPLLLALQSYK